MSEVFFSTRDPAYVSLIRFAGFCVPFACLGYMIIQYFRGMSQTFRAEGIRVAIPLIWVVSLCILFVLGATSVLESGRVFIISQYLI